MANSNMNRTLSDLKHEASQLTPVLNVGKGGITDSLVDELQRQLKQNKLVKVRILKTAMTGTDRRSIAQELSRRTGSQLIEVKGNRAVLYGK